MTELKKLDPNERVFVANGNKYYVSSELSVPRFHEFQILELEAKLNMSLKDVGVNLAEWAKLKNQQRALDADILIWKMIEGVQNIGHREHVLLRICTLFMNRENEDLTKISEDLISQKIADWAEYDVNGFFSQALNSTNGFLKNYNAMLQIISGQKVKAKEGGA